MADSLIALIENAAMVNAEPNMPCVPLDVAVDIIRAHEGEYKPTPDNPCGHSLGIHDVCKRCGMLGAAEFLIKQHGIKQEVSSSEISVIDGIKRFKDWIKDNPDGSTYATAVTAMMFYYINNTEEVWFGDDPYHDNEAMKAAMATLPKRE